MTAKRTREQIFPHSPKNLSDFKKLANEIRKITMQNIPFSENRYQGKYQDVVPMQYKAKKKSLEKEKGKKK